GRRLSLPQGRSTDVVPSAMQPLLKDTSSVSGVTVLIARRRLIPGSVVRRQLPLSKPAGTA
ncbi:MAG: hypothetical protein M3017_05770, partial [Actinomycetota bacterium]|nr:hypothetical protein [Actinomycetota bacterium]